jgi:hypothetical protein
MKMFLESRTFACGTKTFRRQEFWILSLRTGMPQSTPSQSGFSFGRFQFPTRSSSRRPMPISFGNGDRNSSRFFLLEAGERHIRLTRSKNKVAGQSPPLTTQNRMKGPMK